MSQRKLTGKSANFVKPAHADLPCQEAAEERPVGSHYPVVSRHGTVGATHVTEPFPDFADSEENYEDRSII